MENLTDAIVVNVTGGGTTGMISYSVDSMPATGLWFWKVTSSSSTLDYSSAVQSFIVCMTGCVQTAPTPALWQQTFDGGNLLGWTFVPSSQQSTASCAYVRTTSTSETAYPHSGTGYLLFGAPAECNQSAGSNVQIDANAVYFFVWLRVFLQGEDTFSITLGNATLLELDSTNYSPYFASYVYKLARFTVPADLRDTRSALKIALKTTTASSTASQVLVDEMWFAEDFSLVPESTCTTTIPLVAGLSKWCESSGLCIDYNAACPPCSLSSGVEMCCIGTCMWCNSTAQCAEPSVASCPSDCASNSESSCVALESSSLNCTWCDLSQTCSAAADNIVCHTCVEYSAHRFECEQFDTCQWCVSTNTCNSTDDDCYPVISSQVDPDPNPNSASSNALTPSGGGGGGGDDDGDDDDDTGAASKMATISIFVAVAIAALALLV